MTPPPRRIMSATDPDPLAELVSELTDRVTQLVALEEQRTRPQAVPSGNGSERAAQRLLDSVSRILLALLVPALVAIGAVLWQMNGRVSAIEGNRFTSADGVALDERVRAEVREQVADHLRREHR